MKSEGCWSWTKDVVNVALNSNPIGFWNNSHLFFLINDELVLFNPDNQEISNIGIRSILIQVLNYKESLASVEEGRREGRRNENKGKLKMA